MFIKKINPANRCTRLFPKHINFILNQNNIQLKPTIKYRLWEKENQICNIRQFKMNMKKLEFGNSHFWKNLKSGNLAKCGNQWVFGQLWAVVTPSSGWFRCSSSYGCEACGMIFPTPLSFLDFEFIKASYDLWKLGSW